MFIRKYWIPLSVFIVAIAGVGLYLLATQPPKEPIVIYKVVEPEKPTTQVSEGETSQGGHVHEDGTWHAEPHETPMQSTNAQLRESVPVDTSRAPMPAATGAGNPHPFQNVPVDLYDFEATKATMIENINFVKANWHPFEYNREVSIASAISHNIANAANATDLGLYTPEQALELTLLFSGLLEFKGHEPGRTLELREQGYTHKEAIRIAAEETLQRQKQQWGVK